MNKRHPVVVVYMASGYNWCRNCGRDVRLRGNTWVHTKAPYDSFRSRGY